MIKIFQATRSIFDKAKRDHEREFLDWKQKRQRFREFNRVYDHPKPAAPMRRMLSSRYLKYYFVAILD